MTRWGSLPGIGKKSKYGNTFVNVDGKIFDSRKEANRYIELMILQRAGEIVNLRTQVEFILIPDQREQTEDGKGIGPIIERKCAYIADFVYEDAATGKTVVEDTKGFRTKEYIIKRKLMLYNFKIRIREL